MKAHITLLLAAALCAPLSAVAEPPDFIPRSSADKVRDPAKPAELFRRGKAMPIISMLGERVPSGLVFVAPRFEEDEPAFNAALPQAYYVRWREDEGEVERVPARLRHATVGEALRCWRPYYRLFAREHLKSADRAELERLAPGDELPGVWVMEPPLPREPEKESIRLVIPGLGERDAQTGKRADLVAAQYVSPSVTTECEQHPGCRAARQEEEDEATAKPSPAPAAPQMRASALVQQPLGKQQRSAIIPISSGDLVLMQLPGKHELVAYAYRLSDSSPLPQAELQLLDISGGVVVTYPVKDGVAQGELKQGNYRLRLVCGDEVLERPIDWQDYQHEPYPHMRRRDEAWTRGCSFTDRRAYRPGDVVRISGFIREWRERALHFPQGLRAEFFCELPAADGSMRTHRQPVEVAADGTYQCSFRLPEDMKGISNMRAYVSLPGWYYGCCADIAIQENPAPAQMMDGGFSLQGRELRAHATVRSADGSPLTGRGLRWELSCRPLNPVPSGCEGFSFGDCRPAIPLPEEFSPRSGVMVCYSRSAIDELGRAETVFTLPQMPFPGSLELELVADSGYSYTVNGMRHRECFRVDPAELCVGLRRESCVSSAGSVLPLSLVLAESRGCRYEGEPVELCLTVTLHRHEIGRFGVGSRISPTGETVLCRKFMLPAAGAELELPMEEAGAYDIVVRGRDAAGREFASAIRQYVHREGSPLLCMEGCEPRFTPEPDKERYRVGESARLFIAGEVEGEALIMVQGHDSRRFLRQRVTASAHWVDVPLLEEDGPEPIVNIVLVQGKELRLRNGLPAVQCGQCLLDVELDGSHRLDVRLEELPDTPQAGETVELRGLVRDAEGRPVPHAPVLVCAQDVGVTVRFTGQERPELTLEEQGEDGFFRAFMGVREVPPPGEVRFSPKWHCRAGMPLGTAPAAQAPATPEETLMQRVVTDAEGRFCARLTLPEGRADYQVTARAAGQLPTQFGVAAAMLHVEDPLMLSATMPGYAHVGDEVDIPLNLRCASLPAGAPERPRWRVSVAAQEGAECLQTEYEVELGAGEIMPLRVPVRLTAAGKAVLRWEVTALAGQAGTEGMVATLTATLPVYAPAEAEAQPKLSRCYERRCEDGTWEPATHFKLGEVARVSIVHEGAAPHEDEKAVLEDYLPTGCVPVLSEFAEGCTVPWGLRALMDCSRRSGWMLWGHLWVVRKGDSLRFTFSKRKEPQRLHYLVRFTSAGEFTAPPARLSGKVEGSSPATRVVVE